MTDVERSTSRWRWTALSIYLLICFYDFLFVPIWYGLNRPDITGIEQNIAVIEETLVSISESVELAKDYTRTIKNDLKDDLARQESLMDRLENKVNASQDEIDKAIDVAGVRFDARRDALYSDTDRKIKELEERINSKLQRALDNPLAN